MTRLRLSFLLCVLPLVPAAGETLTNFTQVRALSPEAAEDHLPVRLQATVIGSDPVIRWNLFLNDGTAGCYVKLVPVANAPKFTPGTRVQLEGVAMNLGYYPSVGQAKVKVVGHVKLPAPVRLTADQIFLPEFDSAWVEVPALVTGYESKDLRLTLDVEVYGMPFKAELPLDDRAEKAVKTLMQRPVLLRAVLGTLFNNQRQMTDRLFFVPSIDFIQPTTLPGDAGEAELIPIARILTGGYGPQTPVRVRGVVTQAEGRGFYLRDESGSTYVRDSRTTQFSPGTSVEVVGYGDVAPFRPILRATQVQVLGHTNAPVPMAFNFTNADLSLMQAEWVALDAYYLGSKEGSLENILQCRTDGQIFEALLSKNEQFPAGLKIGDKISLAGICELTTTHALPRISVVDGFRLHLAGPDAVRVLVPAPWWTAQRLLVALIGMSGVAVLALFGTWILRRQVNRQLAIISDKLRAEAVGNERDRMARDLHDTLEQQLSGVALQLDGLDDAVKTNPEGASKVLALARRMLRYTRLEARRSVWDLRSKVLQKDGLAAALRAMAESIPEGGPKIELQLPEPNLRLPAPVEFHLFRIAQEALANALKHGRARNAIIQLEQTAGHTRLTVRDDGCGFDPAVAESAAGPHFGLMGMHERAAKLKADLTLTAAPGQGCTVTVNVLKESLRQLS